MKLSLGGDRSTHGGLLVKLLFLLGVLLGIAAVLWVVLLPTLTASSIRSRTGFDAQIESLSVNPFTANVTLTGLVLRNPDGWPQQDFAEVRGFSAEANLFSLLMGDRYVADVVRIDLARVTLVRNQQGVLNAVAFQNGFSGSHPAGPMSPAGAKKGFLIKHLVLKFDKLVFADYSGRKPVVKEYDLMVSRDMGNVDSVTKIISPLTGSALGLVSNAMGGMFGTRPDLLRDTTGLIQDAGKKTGEKLKGLLDALDKRKP